MKYEAGEVIYETKILRICPNIKGGINISDISKQKEEYPKSIIFLDRKETAELIKVLMEYLIK